MACELFAAKYRTFAGTIIANFWAVAVCILALLAYLVHNWVHLQLIISLLGLLTIPLYWYYTLMTTLLLLQLMRRHGVRLKTTDYEFTFFITNVCFKETCSVSMKVTLKCVRRIVLFSNFVY